MSIINKTALLAEDKFASPVFTAISTISFAHFLFTFTGRANMPFRVPASNASRIPNSMFIILPLKFSKCFVHSFNIFKRNIFAYFATGYNPAVGSTKLMKEIVADANYRVDVELKRELGGRY